MPRRAVFLTAVDGQLIAADSGGSILPVVSMAGASARPVFSSLCPNAVINIGSVRITANKSASTTSTEKKYKFSTDLPAQYVPLKRKGKVNKVYSQEEMNNLRAVGAKNVYLWLNPALYPVHRGTGHLPPLSSPTSFVKWLGDGSQGGLYDYVWALHNSAQSAASDHHAQAAQEFAAKELRLQLDVDQARREAQAAVNQAHGERLVLEARLQQVELDNASKVE
jgi:outer membrane murein-binding lipoprotein Lpp